MLTWSAAEPRRHADKMPVAMPTTIAPSVPMVTIGIVFFRSFSSSWETGCWVANETPMLPWASSRR